MTTAEAIREMHLTCTPADCDSAALLIRIDRQQRRNGQLEAALTARNETIRSLLDQRKYLVGRLNEQAGPDSRHKDALIAKLKRSLAATRDMLALQIAATKRQKAKTGRVGNYSHFAAKELDRYAAKIQRLHCALVRARDEISDLTATDPTYITEALSEQA